MASPEYKTLIEATSKMTEAISQDPLAVARKLQEEGLAAPALVRSAQNQLKDDVLKASEIVTKIIGNVESFPENFGRYLKAFSDVHLDQLVKYIHERYLINGVRLSLQGCILQLIRKT